MAMADISAAEILKAIGECDALGREAFLRQYGFGPARRYVLRYGGRLYDSKAIVGVAHGFLPGREPLTPNAFSGGADHAVAVLRALGFEVVDEQGLDVGQGELLGRIRRLRVNRASGRPLLHQPITLLWAIGRARRGEPRLVPWAETVDVLGGLLSRHGAHGERARPDYPVAALHRAGLWELRGHAGTVPSAHGDSALRQWFADSAPDGGLVAPAYDLLRRSGGTRLAVVDALLAGYFESLDEAPLLREVGLYDEGVADDAAPDDARQAEPEADGDAAALAEVARAAQYDRLCRLVERREAEGRGRRGTSVSHDPLRLGSARRAVLLRSDGRCENPGCTGQPADVTAAGRPILDVDHVEDLALGGRDHPSQMVALCPNCHAVKTRGRTREQLRAVLLAVAREQHARATGGRRNP
ncbi:HNH endonuclease signature motif containing protein [Actinacidiphila epipremni]|uniref:HNH endonuclease n=1 Tax=Actinacidiphila epipremni TaxID=2053013 RepID=A0ABX0ZSF4_9ACTN|nr:HNH endonuclease signature motif containing protein [Actinacidiphila epipremni]NJP44521.1 HNH endonuclease [Actinacidiphila epipremni]